MVAVAMLVAVDFARIDAMSHSAWDTLINKVPHTVVLRVADLSVGWVLRKPQKPSS